MASAVEQIIEINQSNVHAIKELAEHAHTGIEQWTALHLSASRSALDEALHHAEASLSARDGAQWLTLQSDQLKALTAQAAGYGQHVYTLLSDSGSAISKSLEARLAQTHSSIASAVDSLEKNAPAGTEAAFAVIKNAVTAGQGIIASAQSSAKRAVDAAQSAITAATQQTVETSTRASRKK